MISQLLTILTVGMCLVQARQSLYRFKRQAFQDDHLDCSHGQGYYQHPMDCRFYYRCWEHQEGDYQRFVFACPYFTVFDTEDNVCKLASLSAPCKTQEQRLIPVNKNNNNNNYNNYDNKNYPSTSKPGYIVPSSTSSYGNQWNKPNSSTKNNVGSTPDYSHEWSNNNNYNPSGNKSPKDNYEKSTNIPDYGSYHDYYPSTDYPDEDHHINNGYTKNGDNSHNGYPDEDSTDYPDSNNGSPNSGSSKSGTTNTGYPNNGYPKGGSPNSGSPNNGSPNSGSPNSGSSNSGSSNTGYPNNGYPKGGSPNSGSTNTGYPNNGYPNSGSPNNDSPNSGSPNSGYTTPKTSNNGYNNNNNMQTTVNMPKSPNSDISVNVPNSNTYNENTLTGKINTPSDKSGNGYHPAAPEPEPEQTHETDRPVFKTSTSSYKTTKPNSGIKYPTSDTSITLSPGSSQYPTPRQGGGGISTAVTQVCQPPKASIKPVFCQGNGFFRHPDNCSQFYQCLSNSYGDMESYVFNCPTGLVFQENGQQQCTYPDEVPECSKENNENINRPIQPKIY